MAPLVEGLLGLMMWLRRAIALVVVALVFVIVLLAIRRAGRRGLELAVLLAGAAVTAFAAAVFAKRPPMNETLAIALAVMSAALLVGAVGAVIWYALRLRGAPPVVGHSGPPWENGGW
jgi:predicted permease